MNPEYDLGLRAVGAVLGGLEVLVPQLMLFPTNVDNVRRDISTVGEIKSDVRRASFVDLGRTAGCLVRMGTVVAGATAGAMYSWVAIGIPSALVGLKVVHEWPNIQRRLRGSLRG